MLPVVDAEIRARYQLAMWADPLMIEVIPEGASSSATSPSSLALRMPLFSQTSWTKDLQAQHGPILTTWPRSFVWSFFPQPCLCSSPATSLVTNMNSAITRSAANCLHRSECEYAYYQSYCARAITRRTWKPFSSTPNKINKQLHRLPIVAQTSFSHLGHSPKKCLPQVPRSGARVYDHVLFSPPH